MRPPPSLSADPLNPRKLRESHRYSCRAFGPDPSVGEDRGADRASNDANVSSIPPIIPYGGFSPVRLEGWLFRRGLSRRHPALACSRHALVGVWFASVLRAPRDRSFGTAQSRACGLDCAPPLGGNSTDPRGPRSG